MHRAFSKLLGRRDKIRKRRRRRRVALAQHLEPRLMLDGEKTFTDLVNTLVPRLQTSQYQSTALEVTPGGDSLIVFSGRGLQDEDGVFFRRLPPNGSQAGPDRRANLTIREAQRRPSLAVYDDGSYVIAWDGRGPGDQQGIFARWYDARDAPLTGEVRINEIIPGTQREPDVAVAADGTTYFVWSGSGGSEDAEGIFRRTFDATGHPLSPQSRVNVTAAGLQNRPGVAAAPDGRSVVTWTSRDGASGTQSIQYRLYSADDPETEATPPREQPASSATTGSQLHSRVGIDDEGRFVIVWSGYTAAEDLWNIYARRFTADGSPRDDHDRLINEQIGGVQRDPDLAMAPDGRYVISWTSGVADGSGWEVYAKVFSADAEGTTAEADFLVNPTSGRNSGHQAFSAVAIGSGPARIAWSGTGGVDRQGVWIRRTSLAERPTLVAIPPQTIDEQTELRLPLAALPGRADQVVRFDLEPGSHPLGMVIDPRTGTLLWRPSERDGPGEFSATVIARDADAPEVADRQTVRITVREVNRPPLLAPLPDAEIDEGETFTATASATDPDLPENRLIYSLVDAPSTSLRIDSTSGQLVWETDESDGAGEYPITVRVTDQGSPQLSALQTFTLTIGETNQPPRISPVLDSRIAEQQTLTVPISASDLDGDSLSYALDAASSAAGMAIDAAGRLRWTPTEAQGPGRFPVTVTVQDSAGLAASVEFEIVVSEVNRPPQLDPLPDLFVDLGQGIVASGSASDPDLPANGLRYSLDAVSRSRGATIDAVTGSIRWTPTSRGVYPMTVTVTDDAFPAATDSESFSVVVEAPFHPPTLDPIGEQTVDELSELRFSLSAAPGIPGHSVHFALATGAPAGLTLDPLTGAVRWTPSEVQGPTVYHVGFEAFDPASPEMRDSLEVPITVREVNRAPTITMPEDISLDEGGVLEVTVAARDPDLPDNQLRFQFTEGTFVPAGATIDPRTGTIRWQTDEATGPAIVVFGVTVFDTGDPSLSDSGTLDVTVHERNQPPVIEPIPDLTIDEMATLDFAIPALDLDFPVDSLHYRLDTASRAAGMTIDAAGQLHWTPSEADGPGRFPVTVTVTDDALRPLTASRSFEIQVREVNRRPILQPVGSFAVRPGTPVGFSAPAFDADAPANTLRYSLHGDIPPGATFDAATGDFQWTPSSGTEPRVYDFTLRVTDDGEPERFDEQPVSIEVLPNHIEMVEEDRFVTAYEQAIVIEPGTAALRFRFDSLRFDDSDPDSINDAFEAALVDAAGRPVAAVVAAGHDAFFNWTESETILLGAGTLFSRDDTSVTITVDVSHLAAGSELRLIQRLVNNDHDEATRVAVIPGIEPLNISPTGESVLVTGDDFPPFPEGPFSNDTDTLWRRIADVTASVAAEYSYTAFDVDTQTIAAGLTLRNTGSYPVRGPLLVAVSGIDLPEARLVNFSGQLPRDASLLTDDVAASLAGAPYYDASELLTEGYLLPGQEIDLQLRFFNSTLERFDYRLNVLGRLNAAPRFVSSPPSFVRLGNEFVYPAGAVDDDDDPLQYEVVSGPPGLAIDADSGRVHWSPSEADLGRHRVQIQVTDSLGGSDSQTFAIDVGGRDGPNRSPAFTTLPTLDAYVGREYVYTAAASDPDFDLLDYGIITGPEGFEMAAESVDFVGGHTTWTPTLAEVGTFVPVTLEVDDGRGGRATQSYRIYVHPDPDNLPPVIVTAPATSLTLPALESGTPVGDVTPAAVERMLARGQSFTTPVSVTLPIDANPRSADIVLVVDESSSMEEQSWIAEVIARLEASLAADGIDDNRYAIIGYGAANSAPRIVNGENDYVLTIYGPAGSVLDSFRVHPGDPLPEFALPTDGTYRVTITQYAVQASPAYPGGTDPLQPQGYDFTPTIHEASPIDESIGGRRSGWGEHAGNLVDGNRQIEVVASAGDLVLVDGIEGDEVHLEIVSARGEVLISDRLLLDDPEPLIFPRSGRYWLRLSGSGSAPFRLRLLDPIADAAPLAVGSLTEATLSDPDEIDLYRFDASAGMPLFIDEWFPPAEFLEGGFVELQEDYWVRVLAPDGSYVGEHRHDSSPLTAMYVSLPHDVGPLTLPAEGTYTVVVSRNGSEPTALAAGPAAENEIAYRFAAHDRSAASVSILDGQTVTASLPHPTASRVYEIPLEAGDALTVDVLAHTGGASTWRLLDPFGLTVASRPGSSVHGDITQLPIHTGGRYRLLIQGHAENIASLDYSFAVSVEATSVPPPTGLSADLDVPILGQFGSSNTVRYQVDLEPGEPLFATLITPGPWAARMRIQAPSGGLVWDSNDVRSPLPPEDVVIPPYGPGETRESPPPPRSGLLTAMQGGRYIVQLDRLSTADDYAFQLASGTSTFVSNQTVAGEVEPGRGLGVFAFEATAGQTLSFAADPNAFADAATAAERAALLEVSGAAEDGYWGIDFALDQLPFRDSASRQLILVTDENRVPLQHDLSFESIEASLREHRVDLHTITGIRFRDSEHARAGDALGIASRSPGDGAEQVELFYADGEGGFESLLQEGYETYDAFSTTAEDYVALGSAVGGTNWSIEMLRDTGEEAELARESFTRAFVSTLTEAVGGELRLELVPSRSDASLEIGPAVYDDRTVTFPVTFHGDGDAWNFDLQFVDAVNPSLLYGSVPVALAAGYRYDLRAIDPEDDAVRYAMTEGPEVDGPGAEGLGASFDAANGTLLWSPTAAGKYAFTVSASDPFGGVDTQSWTVTVTTTADANSPPTLEPVADVEQSAGRPIAIALAAIDPDGDAITFQLLPGATTQNLPPAGLTLDPSSGDLEWRPTTAQVGDHEVTVRAVDGRGGSRTKTFTIHVLPRQPHDNRWPAISSAAPSTAVVGHRYRYAVEASDPDDDLLGYALALAPEGMVIDSDSGVLSWVPGEDSAGPHEVVVRVADEFGGVALQSFSLPVAASNASPEIISLPEGPAKNATEWLYQVRAEDPDGDPIRFSLTTAPPGATLDATTGLLRWTPDQVGQFTFVVRIVDEFGGWDAQPIELTVVDLEHNLAPRIVGSPRQRLTFDHSYVWQIPATDLDHDRLMFELVSGPAGLTIDSDGWLRWTPEASQTTTDSPHPITARVQDSRGGSDTETWLVHVAHTSQNQSPAIVGDPRGIAVANRGYHETFAAADPDGDTILWSLESGPLGMRIDREGTIRWDPQPAVVGSHEVTVRASDTQGGSDTYAYTLTVRGSNHPPAIGGSPPVRHRIGDRYETLFAASDADGDAVRFEFLAGSETHGAILDPQTGRLQWTPAVAGLYRFEVAAWDALGDGSSLSFAVGVDGSGPNWPPRFELTPPGVADVGALYSRPFPATDPDGDPLIYRVDQGPVGLAVSADGTVTWTPPAAALETVVPVELTATDPRGMSASYRFYLPVLAPNRPPEFTSTPPTASGVVGQVYRYDIAGMDPDRDLLTFTLVAGPEGLSLDRSTGRIVWATDAEDVGEHRVRVTLSDGRVATPTDPESDTAIAQTWTVHVVADSTAPRVALLADREVVDAGSEVGIQLHAVDDAGVAEWSLRIGETAVALDASGRARHRFSSPGRYTITCVVRDAAGNSATDSLEILVRDPDNAAPRPRILTPLEAQPITAPQDVVISVADDELDVTAVRLLVAPFDRSLDGSASFQVIASRTAAAGETLQDLQRLVIGRFDPTMLANGRYILRLVAEDAGFNSASVDRVVNVEGMLKLGNFQVAFTDLTIPVAGIPITVVRSYDSLDADRRGDFGHGWSLDVLQATISVDQNTLGSRGSGRYQAFVDGTRLRVRTPLGTEEGFTFRAVPDQTLFGVVLSWKANFDPDPGNTYSLTAASGSLKKLGREYVSGFGTTYNPADPEFGGRFQLKSHADRLTYTIDAATGRAESVEDPQGNALTFTSNGIFSNRGRSVTFLRDMQGRIARIIDPRGNELRYSYDAAGDLVGFTDRMGNTTRMTYHPTPAHFLETILDPLGNPSVTVRYSDSRLASLIDASGEELRFQYDLQNLSQSTSDAEGPRSTVRFDSHGNRIEETARGGQRVVRTFDDPFGGLPTSETRIIGLPDGDSTERDDQTVTRTYNTWGQITSETDDRGNVTRFEYRRDGAPIATVDPLGRTTRFAYDGLDQLSSIQSPTGQTTHVAYDQWGQVIEIRNGGRSSAGGSIDADADPSESPVMPSIQLRYNRFGDLVSQTDSNQVTRTIEYDENGNRTRTEFVWTDPNDPSHNETVISSVALAPNDQPQRVQSPAGTTEFVFDPLKRPRQTVDAYGYITEKIYDIRGLVIEVRTQSRGASGQLVWLVSRTIYDAHGRAIYSSESVPESTPLSAIEGTHTVYDADGRVAATERRVGLEIRIIDRGSSTPRSELASAGTTVSTSSPFYDAAGRIWKRVDHAGRETQTLYDAFGQTIEHRTQAETEQGDRIWLVTRTAYDPLGRVIFTTDRFPLPAETPLGEGVSGPVSTRHTVYDSLGRTSGTQRVANSVVEIVDGAVVVVEAGELVSQSTNLFNDAGKIARTISASGEITDYLYDSRGRQIASIGHPLAAESVGMEDRYPGKWVRPRSEIEFDRYGKQSLERNGVIQIEEADGSLVEVDYAEASETRFHYDSLGRLTRTLFPDGSSESVEYDAQGRVVAEVDRLGLRTEFGHDASGRLTSVSLPETVDPATGERAKPTYEYEYDAQGNQTLIRDPLGHETRFTYDHFGLQQSRTLPLGHGADGVLGTEDDGDVPADEWSERFGYDRRGRRTWHVSFEGVVTESVYDDQSSESGSVPSGRVVEKRFFESRESYIADPNSPKEVWKFTYDAAGREVRIDETEFIDGDPSTRTVTKSYDASGRLIEQVTPEGTLHYTYNPLGQRTATTIGDPSNPIRTTEYQYDVLGRLQTVTERSFVGSEPTDAVHRYFYDLRGRLDAELAAGGLYKDYEYDAMNHLERLTHYRTDGSLADLEDLSDDQEIVRFDYAFRPDGSHKTLDETWWRDPEADGTFAPYHASSTYTYDELGRLTDEVFDHWDDALDYHDSYVMDLAGNRLSKSRDLDRDGIDDRVTDYTYDANDRLISQTTRNAAGKVVSEVHYQYDHTQTTGKTITDGAGVAERVHRYSYDPQGRMSAAVVTSYDAGLAAQTRRMTYQYDSSGIRIRSVLQRDDTADGSYESASGIDFLVDHANFTGHPQVVRETHQDPASGVRVKTVDYTYGQDELAQTTTRYAAGSEPESAVRHTFLHDAHGSVRGLLDATATLIAAAVPEQIYFYDAYGNRLGNNTATTLTELLYSGERFDAATGQQYLRARYYDPQTGRFTRLDPYAGAMQEPQSYHKYTYAHSDPIQGTDPTGKFLMASTTLTASTSSKMRGANAVGVAGAASRILLRIGWQVALARAALQIEMLSQEVVPLPRQKVLEDYEYALLASAGYETADLGNLPNGWHPIAKVENRDTGFHARLLGGKNKIVLSFAGTLTTADWINNLQQGVFGDAPQYRQADREIEALGKRFGQIDRFVGHSLGGGLASAVAIIHDRPATTFNAAGVNPRFVGHFGKNLTNAERLIDAYRVQGEILSTLQDMSFVWSGAAPIGIRSVGVIGQVAPDSVGHDLWLEGDSHSLIMRHFMAEVLVGMRKMM